MNEGTRGHGATARIIWSIIAFIAWVLLLTVFANAAGEEWKSAIAFFGLIAMMGLTGLFVTSTE